MASEPVGPNHLSATEEGRLDMPQPLEQWISTVPCLKTQTSPLHACCTFFLSDGVEERHVLPLRACSIQISEGG